MKLQTQIKKMKHTEGKLKIVYTGKTVDVGISDSEHHFGGKIVAELRIGEGDNNKEITEANAARIVKTWNSHDKLLEAAKAAIKYSDAIESCGNDPDKMASFCTAQGDDLDTLYHNWISKSIEAINNTKS